MTNGEMIRNMSDEELAVTIACPNEMGLQKLSVTIAITVIAAGAVWNG